MIKPTHAQIEAVEDVLRGLVVITGDSTWDMNYVAKAALTAAAEVGADQIQIDKAMTKYERGIENATIERCARVAEKTELSALKPVAAAIRALKDKP